MNPPSRSKENSKNRSPKNNSFLVLLKTHHSLTAAFLAHQEALLRCDFSLALQRLVLYERRIKCHIREEENFLMPVYSRAGKVLGGDPQLFIGEHQRIVEFIERLKKMLPTKKGRGQRSARQAIEILYQEAMFRWLIEHHDERERQILYPTLDRVTTISERASILKKCS